MHPRRRVPLAGSAEPGARVEVSWPGGSAAAAAGESGGWRTAGRLPEGPVTLRVTARDAAGNATRSTRRVTTDTTSPALEIVAPPKLLRDEDTLTVSGAVPGEAARQLTYSAGVNGRKVAEAEGAEAGLPDDLGDYGYYASLEETPLTLEGRRFSLDFGRLPQGRNRVVVVVRDVAGNATRRTVSVMVDTSETFGDSELVRGAKGEDVSTLQRRLKRLHLYRGRATAIFNRKTERAVTAYQRTRKIARTGRVDAATLKRMIGRVVINLEQRKLRLIQDGRVVETFPVAVGQPAYPTPTGKVRGGGQAGRPGLVPAGLALGGRPGVDPARAGQPARHALDRHLRPGDRDPRHLRPRVDRHRREPRLHPDVHRGRRGALRSGQSRLERRVPVSVLELTADGWDDAVLAGERPVLVDFWAAWCAPCRAVAPVMAELAAEYSERVTVASLNVEDHPAPAVRHQVLALPTVILFSGGRAWTASPARCARHGSCPRSRPTSREGLMPAIYFSLGVVQPFADLTSEEIEEGVVTVVGDGKIVGLRLADNRMLLRLDEIAARLDLDPERVWARVRADDDLLTGRRGDLFGGVTGPLRRRRSGGDGLQPDRQRLALDLGLGAVVAREGRPVADAEGRGEHLLGDRVAVRLHRLSQQAGAVEVQPDALLHPQAAVAAGVLDRVRDLPGQALQPQLRRHPA